MFIGQTLISDTRGQGCSLGTVLPPVFTSVCVWPLPDPEPGAPPSATSPWSPPMLGRVSCDLVICSQPYLGWPCPAALARLEWSPLTQTREAEKGSLLGPGSGQCEARHSDRCFLQASIQPHSGGRTLVSGWV